MINYLKINNTLNMKKLSLSIAIAILTLTTANAQDDTNISSEPTFGIKAGYSSTVLKVSVDGNSASEDISGFYFGFFGEFNMSEKIDLQPELNFASYSQDGESTGILLIPILVKYKANEKFGLLAGPQFDYLLNEEDSEGLKRIGLGIAIGASYDITENVIIDARYTFGLSDRLDGDLEGLEDFNVKAKFNYFQVGLGYRF